MQKTAKKTTISSGVVTAKLPKAGAITGLRDIAAQANPYWSIILQQLRATAQSYGFQPVETAILEEERVYTDFYKTQPEALERIIFSQLGGKTLGVRSAVLPSVLRHYVQNKIILDEQSLSKWLYIGNVAEIDERQSVHFSYQFGLEVLGAFNHLSEAQVVSAMWDLTQRLGLGEEDVLLEINTVGDASVQTAYANVLKDFLKGKEFELCENCNNHLRARVLNVLRCNQVGCQLLIAEAPAIVDFLDTDARKQFTDILEALDELGLPYQLNSLYVGPEGSSGTNLVLKYKKGSETVVIGEAAHHDLLLKNITGKAMPAFGFSGNLAGLSRAMELSEVEAKHEIHSEVFLVPLGELASKRSLRLFRDLLAVDIKVHDHFGTIGVKNQLKLAEESKAPLALIMGQKEAMDDMVILRDVKSGMQEIFSYDKIIAEVKKRLER
ncbi:MAG TPA: ATP phosphoribosyltransferase regulatory subunit [Patescibacteria group bacterium]|jgi:histidyl-tRNA synthetase|nr:ATP phosphoribosyltransferase regulatory subunit [Patescibacteria group bacterium]